MLGAVASVLAIGDEEWMNEVGWPLLFLIGLFVASLYIWSYVSRSLEKLRTKEGKYHDSEVISFLSLMVKIIIVIILTMATLFVVSQAWEWFRLEIWDPGLPYFLDMIIIITIFLLAMLLVKVLRRIAFLSRTVDTGNVKMNALHTTSVVLGYVVYVVAIVISLLVLITLVPEFDLGSSVGDFVTENYAIMVLVLVIILAIYAVIKLMEEMLEDYKYRTKKFNPQVIDLFKMVIRYTLWIIALLTITYSLFYLFNLEEIGLILVLIILAFIIIGLALAAPTLKNIFAGLALMDTSIYDLNDHLIIGEDLEGDVIQKNLLFTEMRKPDGTFIHMPNSVMIASCITNMTRSAIQVINLTFAVDFSMTARDVDRLVSEALSKVEGLLKQPAPELMVEEVEENRLCYRLRVFLPESTQARNVRHEIIVAIQEAFHRAGVEKLF